MDNSPAPAPAPSPRISFVIPVFNEEETVETLASAIIEVCQRQNLGPVEILFIDDGSTDQTWKQIEAVGTRRGECIRGYRFRKNFGKAAALSQGFSAATGQFVFTLDGDLQDDPEEIPRFMAMFDQDFDLISGWKKERHDPVSKTVPSRLFNKVTAWLSGVHLHDFNCGFKAYRREVVESISLYGELHRYIPVLAHEQGYRVGEIEVLHHPREHGVSKYGWRRYMRGFLDLLTVIATTRYLARPAHLFGSVGAIVGGVGLCILVYLSALWFMGDRPIGNRPLFFLGILCVLLAAQMISFGLLAEIFNRRLSPQDTGTLVRDRLH